MKRRTLWLVGACSIAAAHALTAQIPTDTASLRLVLNIPAYRLDAFVDGRLAGSMRVAIGSKEHPTPIGHYAVTDVTWNPWWYPPPSPWARGDTVTPPCPANPMGRVKLRFAPSFFIHGTPMVRSVGRASSHGCVRSRNDDALALAELAARHGASDSASRVGAWAAGRATRHLTLTRVVPLDVRYDLAEMRGDSLHLYPDVYARVRRMGRRLSLVLAVLAASGMDSTRVDRVRLREFVERSRQAAVAIPATVLPGDETPPP
jgi:murein L,D-transpeptidase YcbB/YkuD